MSEATGFGIQSEVRMTWIAEAINAIVESMIYKRLVINGGAPNWPGLLTRAKLSLSHLS